MARKSKRALRSVPVIDLFAGPGGLGEGFSAQLASGASPFDVRLSIEKDPVAHKTLELRAFVRQFDGEIPREYYQLCARASDRDALYRSYPNEAAAARQEAWCEELGALRSDTLKERVRAAVGDRQDAVVIGGPPCQAYSLVGRSRNRGKDDYSPEADDRHVLYMEYLKVLTYVWPAVFVMENVKGLLSARYEGSSMFERILEDLSDPGRALGRVPHKVRKRYDIVPVALSEHVEPASFDENRDARSYVVRSEDFGVPQARHRVILLGIRQGIRFRGAHLRRVASHVSCFDAIGTLPPLRSGVSGKADSYEAWCEVVRSVAREPWFRALRREDREVTTRMEQAIEKLSPMPRETFEPSRARLLKNADWYRDERLTSVLNHSTRSHMPSDLQRYLFASAFASVHGRSPKLGDFPASLLPEHANAREAARGGPFEDRFRVQLRDRPATTIASHISKDGHYYIHYDPTQCRSLTVREAARLQTFPDNYFFCGGRTAQYHQVGNAVPPLLARQIAEVVADILG